ncbi:PLD nuclease N-terminal domain-containing protein [Bhargavaea ullalensis]|uniref:Cardiolipin synthase N-terminal domain-containing protein n=1 Tax=Bhargavaea ullalensis TaxID=1265685 RepID=A0ABV2GFM9_9BACL
MPIKEMLAEVPWGLIWPLFVIELILKVIAFADLYRKRTANGPVYMWVLIVLFINTLGPILYFTIGRRHE